MDSLALLIKKFREDRGMTQKDLAKKTGLGTGTIGDIERGDRKGKVSTLDKIAQALLLTPNEKKKLDNAYLGRKIEIKIVNDEFISIPIKAVASAGNGYLNFEEDIKTVMIRKNGFDSNCYLIEVNGDSMEPLIQDGAYIVVDPREIDIINNKIYIVEFEGEVYIKRVIVNDEIKVIILKSINQKYNDMYITKERIENFKIKGRAVKFILEGKL